MKKKNYFVLGLCFLISNICYSQTVSIDETFGENGKIIIPNTSGINMFDFDANGNIISAGYTMIGCGGKYHLTITKTNADGILDNSFGNSGVVKVTDYDNSMPYGLKITNDNKIVVFGSFTEVQFQGRETIIMRFNENGTVDEDFGDNGKVNLNFNTGYLMSLNTESDDFILLGKRENEIIDVNGTLYDILIGYSISKYTYSGELVESFGDNGKILLEAVNTNGETFIIFPSCIKILNDESILIAGFGYEYDFENIWNYSERELAFCKLTPNGKLDTDFANNGIWHLNIMQDFDLDYESFSNIFEDNEGNLILSGNGLTNSQGWGNRAFLSKFSPNGILDESFGENGFYCFDFGGGRDLFQINDKYITAGWNNNNTYKLIYVNTDGSFGDYIYDIDIHYFRNMKLQGNNKIILAGGHSFDNTNFVLERVAIDLEGSINSNELSNPLIVFPNPTTDGKINIQLENTSGMPYIINVFDESGNLVYLSSMDFEKQIDLSKLSVGVYFIGIAN